MGRHRSFFSGCSFSWHLVCVRIVYSRSRDPSIPLAQYWSIHWERATWAGSICLLLAGGGGLRLGEVGLPSGEGENLPMGGYLCLDQY